LHRLEKNSLNRKKWEYSKDILGDVTIEYKDKTETRLNLLYYQAIPFDEVENFLIPFVENMLGEKKVSQGASDHSYVTV
jgi:hypothetical protein